MRNTAPLNGAVTAAPASCCTVEERAVFNRTEALILDGVEWLRLILETCSATVIAVGVVTAAANLTRHWIVRSSKDFAVIRLWFARYLVLALEFQLAADILSTAIAPTWEQIGKLGAIAVIRTGLNYFLTQEMREERREVDTTSTTEQELK
jgi:uncharacterized membrane protein